MSSTTEAPASSLQFLPPADLKPSPLNPRKRFDDARLQELAESFKSVGVIEPLVVRRVNGHFETVCGDRRSRAAQLAQLETVPVIVKELTDTQVLEIMVIENNQREDVNALEEADGFSRLLKTGYDIEKLAERIGRSRKYIYDRVKLLDLVPTAKTLLLDQRFTPGHAILIARLKPDDQTKVMQHGLFAPEGRTLDDDGDDVAGYDRDLDEPDENFSGMKPRTVRELERHIADHVRFDVKHAAAAVPLEFGELAHRVEVAQHKPGRGKKVISITFEHYVNPDARTDEERTFGPRSFRFADGKPHEDGWSGKVVPSPPCEHAVLGVVVAGEKYGQAFDVCIARDKCQVHWKQEIAERSKNQKLRESGKGKVADNREAKAEEGYQERWKREAEERKRRDDAWGLIRDRALTALATSLKKAGPNGRVLEALEKAFISRNYGDDRKLFDRLMGKVTAANIAVALLFAEILEDVAHDCGEFMKVVKPFGVDLSALETEYRQALAPAKASTVVKATAPVKKKSAAKKKAVQTSARGKKKR